MSKGKRRQEREAAKAEVTLFDLKHYKGLSKYQRKKMEQKGVDMNQFQPEQKELPQ